MNVNLTVILSKATLKYIELINCIFLLFHTVHFDSIIALTLLVFESFFLLLSASGLRLNQYSNSLLKYINISEYPLLFIL